MLKKKNVLSITVNSVFSSAPNPIVLTSVQAQTVLGSGMTDVKVVKSVFTFVPTS